jgi:hypothetical protein
MVGAEFRGFMVRTERGQGFDKDGVEVTAALHLTFPLDQGLQARWQGLVPKLGLLLRRGQTAALAWRGTEGTDFEPLDRSDPVAGELVRLFGHGPDETWAGFYPRSPLQPEFPAPNVARWTVRLRVAPRQSRPQLVPVIGVHYQAEFSDRRHLATLWVLPAP